MFEMEEGKALLRQWGLPDTLTGVASLALGRCALGYALTITGLRVGAESVEVDVTLTREAAAGDAINGTLNFYGAATLAAFKSDAAALGASELSNEDFGDGKTATATIPLRSEAPPAFFNAKIDEH